MIPRLWFSMLALGAIALGVGCDRRESPIRSYAAPKDGPQAMLVAAGEEAVSPRPQAASAPIQWTLPADWHETPNTEPMRLATFSVAGSDSGAIVTLSQMGRQELLANVRRWAGQVGLSGSDSDLLKTVTHTQVAGESADVVELTGPAQANAQPRSILAAMVPHGDASWIIKLSGPAEIVSAQHSNFQDFLHSLRFSGQREQQPTPQIRPDQGGQRLAKWTAPAGWTEVANSSSIRLLTFRLGPKDNPADAAVEKFPASVLDQWEPNLVRWREQVGLDPVVDPNSIKPTNLTIGGTPGQLFEFVGPAKALVIAVVQRDGVAWFFKLQGPRDVVSDQKAAFLEFLNSVQFE